MYLRYLTPDKQESLVLSSPSLVHSFLDGPLMPSRSPAYALGAKAGHF